MNETIETVIERNTFKVHLVIGWDVNVTRAKIAQAVQECLVQEFMKPVKGHLFNIYGNLKLTTRKDHGF